MTPEPDIDRRVAVLEDTVQTLQDRVVDDVTATDAEGSTLSVKEASTLFGINRRDAMKLVGFVALTGASWTAALHQLSQPARAQATGNEGTESNPLQKVWTHAMEAGDGRTDLQFEGPVSFNHTSVSTASTVSDANVIEYDPSVSGFTLTIGSPLEERGLPVVLQETGGSDNAVTLTTQSGNDIDGSGSVTLDQANARTVIYFEGGEWRTNWFTVTANIGELTAGDIDIDGVPSGGVSTILTAILSTAGSNLDLRANDAVTVDTSATRIWTATGFLSFVIVFGETGASRFVDMVGFEQGVSADDTELTASTGITRTYSADGSELDLAMGSSTFEVAAVGFSVTPES